MSGSGPGIVPWLLIGTDATVPLGLRLRARTKVRLGMRPCGNIIPLAPGGHLEFLLLRSMVLLFLSIPPPFVS